jgi:hypothetical protein
MACAQTSDRLGAAASRPEFFRIEPSVDSDKLQRTGFIGVAERRVL